MASTSAAEPSSAMEETPNWLEMPHDLMGMILQRLGAIEILISAQKVCTTWRRICKEPAMWKVIDMYCSLVSWHEYFDREMLSKQAVHRSRGELIDISIECFGTDDLLDYISQCSSKLKYLHLVNYPSKSHVNGYLITSSGLIHAIKRLPHLEKLHLFCIEICVEDIEVIARSCPLLKSFKMDKVFKKSGIEFNGDAIAIANNMPGLRLLHLFGNKMTNVGLQAILHGCPHLESLNLRQCFELDLGGNLGKLCMERIKDLKLPDDPIDDSHINDLSEDDSSEDDLYFEYDD